MPVLGPRPSGTTSKLLPTGSGTFIGKPSALLGDAGASKPVPAPNLIKPVGVLEPLNQVRAEREKVIEPLLKPAALATPVDSPAILERKTNSLLKEFISVGDLKEAKLCVEELQSPGFHPRLVQMAITILLESLEGQQRERDLIRTLLEHLCAKKVLSGNDTKAGIILTAEQLEDVVIDNPSAAKHFGDLVGKLLVSDVIDLGFLVDILKKTEDPFLKRRVYDSALKAIESGPNAQSVLGQQAVLDECERLIATT
jgi:translation initiation factor 4G